MQFRSTRQVELLGDFEVCNMIRSTSVQVKCVSLFEEVRRRITRANVCVCVVMAFRKTFISHKAYY